MEKTWGFENVLACIGDSRVSPRIPARSVWLSVFGMHALRLGSHNALGQQLKMPKRWEPWVGNRKPSVRTIERSTESMDIAGQRDILATIARAAKRKKVFRRLYPDVHWVGALDGQEPYCSFKRCCPQCLTRELTINDRPVIQYYHRYVVLQLVGVVPALPLDIEPLLPGDTEATAGLRLLRRFTQSNFRFLDVVTLDAFYLQAPFVLEVLKLGLTAQIILKQENRELYQDAQGLYEITPSETIHGLGKETRLWDMEELTSWKPLGRPVRVIRSLETETVSERIAGKSGKRVEERDWQWVIIAPDGAEKVSPETVRRWGHARWDEETRGFGELTQHWNLDHNYHHHPTAMLANLITLFLAFFLTTVFFDRNLKPPQREGRTRLHLSGLFMDDLVLRPYESFWGHPP